MYSYLHLNSINAVNLIFTYYKQKTNGIIINIIIIIIINIIIIIIVKIIYYGR